MNTIRKNITIFVMVSFIIGLVSFGVQVPHAHAKSANSPVNDLTNNLARNRSDNGINYSNNWSGYTITGNNFNEVHGNWEVPEVTFTGRQNVSGDGTWVGIGGVSADDLIQVGTLAFANPAGDVAYKGFYEILPHRAVAIPIKINSGDSITASVQEYAQNEWQVILRNNTTGAEFSQDVLYKSSNSSAEWIEERPIQASTGDLIPFNNFDSIKFTDIGATKGNRLIDLSDSNAKSITMISNRNIIAQPSLVEKGSKTFTVTRRKSKPIRFIYSIRISI